MLKVLDLFSGIGGFSLGFERAGMNTVAFCEKDPFCRAVLQKHWPDIECYKDIEKLDGRQFQIDVVCGGYPCQPFSTASAGRRVAKDLWPEMFRIISECEPSYIIAENVAELPQRHAERALWQLGYRTTLKRISGDDIGADHTRNRWWLCAYPNNEGELYSAIDAEVAKLPELCRGIWSGENYARAVRVSNGIPNRVDRNRALGNTVFPMIPEAFARAIMSVQKVY